VIITITLNTCIDHVTYVPRWQPDSTLRAAQTLECIAGKPTDASYILAEMGIGSRALGFKAGHTGDIVERLLRGRSIDTHFIEVDGETRRNLVVISEAPRQQTTITASTLWATSDHATQLEAVLETMLQDASCVVLGGTLPNGINADYYRALISMIRSAGVPTIFDASGPFLKAGIAAKPTYIKPNRDELSQLVGWEVDSMDAAYRAGCDVRDEYAVQPIISLGAEGGLAILQDKSYYIPPLPVSVVNAAGAGDAILAGLAASIERGQPIEEGLRLGFGAATAVVTQPGTAECYWADIEAYMQRIDLIPYQQATTQVKHMNTNFEFATANRIIFGSGALRNLPDVAAPLGKRSLLLATDSRLWVDEVCSLLENAGIVPTVQTVAKEPSIESVREITRAYRDNQCEFIISVGGGSVIDTGKAVSALVTNPGDPLDYLEVIGKGKKLTEGPVPFIAIPTTAGTGAEVTRNAVLFSGEHRVKISLRSPMMLPSVALVDPELTYTVPPAVTASTGMDALTQVIEPYLSCKATVFTDLLCREGIERAGRSLQRAYHDWQDREAREDMTMVSLLGGLALANAKLGAVHGFAGVLGGMYGAPHGAICARLLAPVMRTNLEALRARDPKNPLLGRFDEIAQMLCDSPDATTEAGVRWIEDVSDELALQPLGTYGVQTSDFPEIIAKSRQSSSMKGNPIMLTDDELSSILAEAL